MMSSSYRFELEMFSSPLREKVESRGSNLDLQINFLYQMMLNKSCVTVPFDMDPGIHIFSGRYLVIILLAFGYASQS
jgi:hypothetical protein